MHKFTVSLAATLPDNLKPSIIIEVVPNQFVTIVKGLMGYKEKSRKYKAENWSILARNFLESYPGPGFAAPSPRFLCMQEPAN